MPYASPAHVQQVLTLCRQGELPSRLTHADIMETLRPCPTFAARLHHTLSTLLLIHEDGCPTHVLTTLAHASGESYQATLRWLVRKVYRDVLARLDMQTATYHDVAAAFVCYAPDYRHKRMARLFWWLCGEAGLDVLSQK